MVSIVNWPLLSTFPYLYNSFDFVQLNILVFMNES